jgi:Cu+-exporting ATPase
MADQLYKVPGVAKVETNIEAKMMFVTPKPAVVLSPRALWEAIEKASKVPVKLEGPSGTFAAKPQV